MIEPYVTERQCNHCRECKPMTAFGKNARWPDGISRRCMECDRKSSRTSMAKRRALRPRKEVPVSPTAWLLPADPRDFRQQLLSITQQRWGYECEPAANLTWIIGAVA